jgi:hypothetical protein
LFAAHCRASPDGGGQKNERPRTEGVGCDLGIAFSGVNHHSSMSAPNKKLENKKNKLLEVTRK